MGNLPQSEDGAIFWQKTNFNLQIGITLPDFSRVRLIQRRQAFDCVGDAYPVQLQRIVGRFGNRVRCRSQIKQRLVKQDAGIIAGEWPAAAVGSMHAGSEPDNQQARIYIAKGRDRAGMVIGMRVTDAGQESVQTRAKTTV